jgi:hypothetical protein
MERIALMLRLSNLADWIPKLGIISLYSYRDWLVHYDYCIELACVNGMLMLNTNLISLFNWSSFPSLSFCWRFIEMISYLILNLSCTN